ncbi:ArsR family transcriptional regulator [Pseudonocardiaceae bacterium YIM PH 21723]|nr:ArsR family transcriptional regulator [Pseudonocardiaceae bacterium YIM PH 21723]
MGVPQGYVAIITTIIVASYDAHRNAEIGHDYPSRSDRRRKVDNVDTEWLPQPDPAEIEIGKVLHALADPIRLQIVRLLDERGGGSCTSLPEVPVKPSTVSHHLRTLREAGVVASMVQGNARKSVLRDADLETRFPGLLTAILRAT